MAAAFQVILEAENAENKIRKPRIFKDRFNPLDGMDDEELIAKYRLSRQCILDLLEHRTAHANVKRNWLAKAMLACDVGGTHRYIYGLINLTGITASQMRRMMPSSYCTS